MESAIADHREAANVSSFTQINSPITAVPRLKTADYTSYGISLAP